MLYEDKLDELKWYYRKYGRKNLIDHSSSVQTTTGAPDTQRSVAESDSSKTSDEISTVNILHIESKLAKKVQPKTTKHSSYLIKTPKQDKPKYKYERQQFQENKSTVNIFENEIEISNKDDNNVRCETFNCSDDNKCTAYFKK